MKIKPINRKIIFRIIIIGVITFLLMLITSYLTIVPSLRERAITTARNTNLQLIKQADYILAYVKDYAESIALSDDLKTQITKFTNHLESEQNYYLVCLSLNKLSRLRSNIRCIMLETDDHTVFNSITGISEADYGVMKSDWYRSLWDSNYASGFSNVYQIDMNGTKIYTAAYSKHFYFAGQRITITIFFNANDIIYNTQVLAKGNFDHCLWLDSTNSVFYSSGFKKWDEKTLKNISHFTNSIEPVPEFGGINFENVSVNSKWRIISFVSESTIFKSFQGYVYNIALILLLFLVFTITLMTPTISRIIKPIGRLASVMSKVSMGNLDCVADVNTNDEIGELSRVFNKMIQDLKHNIQVIIEKEKKEQRIKYSLLVSQIDPHFIYNTINSINYLARKGRCQDIVAVNSALISILQDRLRVNDIQIMDTIEREINTVKQYLLIQSYLYESDLEVLWDVDEALKKANIPKNIIQPLVENAMFHGLIDEETGRISGKIEISIKSCEGHVVVKVKDNGRGMDDEKLKQLQADLPVSRPEERGKHIGIQNIKGRLFYLYGNNNCMQIKSEQLKGTCVILNLKINEILPGKFKKV